MNYIRPISGARYLIVVLLVVLALAACSQDTAIDPFELGDSEVGEELFHDLLRFRCVGCHTLDGKTHRPGPTLQGISEVAGDRVPDLSAVEYLRQSILSPTAYIVEGFEDEPDQMRTYMIAEPEASGRMEKFTLTEEELSDLIAFIMTH